MNADILSFSNSTFRPDMRLKAMQQAFWGEGCRIRHEEYVGCAIYNGVADRAELFERAVTEGQIGNEQDGITVEYMDDKSVLVSKEIGGVVHFLEYSIKNQKICGDIDTKRLVLDRAGRYERLEDNSTLIVSYPFNTLFGEDVSPTVTEICIFDSSVGTCQKFKTNIYNGFLDQWDTKYANIFGLESPGVDASLWQILHTNETVAVNFKNRNDRFVFDNFDVSFCEKDEESRLNTVSAKVNEIDATPVEQVGVYFCRGRECSGFVPVSIMVNGIREQKRIMMVLKSYYSLLSGIKIGNDSLPDVESFLPEFRDEGGRMLPWFSNIRIGTVRRYGTMYYTFDMEPTDWVELVTTDGRTNMNIDKILDVYRKWWEYLKSQQN